MDDESNYRKNRHRRRKGWEFTFFGETFAKGDEWGKRAEFTPVLANDHNKQVFPLSSTQVGDCVVIQQIQSGKNLVRRLSEMGFNLGSEVEIISKTKSGSVIVCLEDEQIGLGAGMANQVMVTFAAKGT